MGESPKKSTGFQNNDLVIWSNDMGEGGCYPQCIADSITCDIAHLTPVSGRTAHKDTFLWKLDLLN